MSKIKAPEGCKSFHDHFIPFSIVQLLIIILILLKIFDLMTARALSSQCFLTLMFSKWGKFRFLAPDVMLVKRTKALFPMACWMHTWYFVFSLHRIHVISLVLTAIDRRVLPFISNVLPILHSRYVIVSGRIEALCPVTLREFTRIQLIN